MARRTKAEAEQTRHKLLDAAETLFLARGVSRTSLQDIASAAGATRGAIYWHFQDKADLFNAMLQRVTLPLERALEAAAEPPTAGTSPLRGLYDTLLAALHATAHDPQTGRVFEIATHKVEYVAELQAVAERRLAVMDQMRQLMQRVLTLAAERLGRPLPMPAAQAALGLNVLIDGLITNWLIDRGAFDLEEAGRHTLRNYLRGLGLEDAL